MKKNILESIIISMCIILSGCNSNASSNENTSVLAITNTVTYFTNNETGDISENCNKYIHDSYIVQYKNDSEEWVDFDCSTFGIDFNSLIVGDALIISHYGTCMIQTTIPSVTYISGPITKVEVKYTNIYEVVLHKNNDNDIYFEYLDSTINIEIGFNGYYQNNFCITQNNGEIALRALSEYEDGTILYYSYNPVFLDPIDYTWLFDYKPK